MCWTMRHRLWARDRRWALMQQRNGQRKGINARWPQELQMSDDVIALVDEKWKKYGF